MGSYLAPSPPSLAPWQAAAIYSPFEHTALFAGVGSGKSFTGAQYAIQQMIHHPTLTGFIGANTYDQLSQATLRELFIWLDRYRIPWVINQNPPKEWRAPRKFAKYNNVLSCRIGPHTVHAFTRVLSDADALRGIQFSWYHLDETRDTPNDSHDVILSRMRESRYKRGLITTTTNGEDWGYHRFAKARKGQRLYGSLHVRTEEAVKLGILTQSFYRTLLESYSELMIAQELNALHVNVHGGLAYYAASEYNRKRIAPWGDRYPNPSRPLIIGCDFNFDPAPHIWMVGQVGPAMYGPNGVYWGNCIHWFAEIAENRCSTVQMTQKLVARYPGFFLRVFGDRSGARATTSNAGKPDYDQMAQVLSDAGAAYGIDSDQGNNPLVRNRVENMNRLFKDGTGTVRQTYNPDTCPHFDSDLKMVGWKPMTLKGQGRLDSGGNAKLTHASDGAGYACWKLFPFGKRARIVSGIGSLASEIVGPRA